MPKKYIIVETYGKLLHAGSKATNDAAKIIAGHGYEPIYIKSKFLKSVAELTDEQRKKLEGRSKTYMKFRMAWYTLWAILYMKKLGWHLEDGSVLLIQYPLVQLKMRPEIQARFLKSFFRKKRLKLQVLINDLDSIRLKNPRLEKSEASLFRLAEKVICHNRCMKDWLLEHGVHASRILELTLFDYLHDGNFVPHKSGREIVFAGNLCKAAFLFDGTKLPADIDFNLYGVGSENIKFTPNMHYKGTYTPEVLPSMLRGSFGLVWDGHSAETCAGFLGDYLRYNSSHKISLYMVARLPVIIWKQAAMAQFIEENNLGLAVDSLFDIFNALKAVDDRHYAQMLESVEKYALMLESGSSLSACI